MKELKTVWLDKNLLMVKPQSNSTLERLICYLNFASSFSGSEQLFHKTLYKNYFIKMKFSYHSCAQSEQLKHKNKVRDMFKGNDEGSRTTSVNDPISPFLTSYSFSLS